MPQRPDAAAGGAGQPGGAVSPTRSDAHDTDAHGAQRNAESRVSALSGGEALPAGVRGSFESSLNTDLGGVRVHPGPDAAAATSRIGARAFAVGNDIAFGAGQYSPDSPDGRWLLAHEVAHTVQQRGSSPVAQGKLETTHAGDPAEAEADRAADAMVSGGRASVTAKPRAIARFPPMGPVGGGSKEDTPAWKKQAGPAKDYVEKYGQAIINGLHAQLASVPFETGLDGVTWAAGNAQSFAGQFALEFFLQRGDPWQFLVTTLAPDDVERLIDKGRDALAMPDMARWYNPGIQVELGNVYKARIRDALLRAVPRYVGAWNQHVLAEEAKLGKRPKDAAPPVAPEPAASEVRASTPIDPYILHALRSQLKVDFRRYRELHPAERQAHAIKRVDKITLEIQWRKQAINWVRASPPEATTEDVAAELYGAETFAYLITPAAPLFGFQTDPDSIRHLKPAYRDQLQKIQGSNDYHGSVVPEHGRPDDPVGQLLGGPLGDEAAKNQARDIKPTPDVSKAGIVERMRAIVGEFEWLQQSVKPWGQEALLDAAKHKVDQRSRELAKTSDPGAGGDWDGQSQVQLEVVQTARNAVHVAARQEEAFKTFPSARWLIINLVRDYIEAAAISDLGASARTKLAAAEQKSRMFPAELMEALLDTFRPVIHSAKIKKTKLEGRAGDWDDARYSAGAMEKKELELRQGLAKVRDLLMEHPEKAKPELDRLLKEVTTLSTEVTLVSNMDSCDAAWSALDASLSKVGTAVSWVTSNHGNAPIKRDMAAVATMRLQWRAIYDKWKAAKTPEDKKAAENELSVKAKSKEWAELFETIRKDIEDHATYDKWVTFGVMVGIAIITGGIGAYVEAAAGAAWGAAAGFAASTVAEAATFTTLSQTLVQKDATLATFFDDFEKNLLMFGGLKAVGKVWGVTGKALGLEADEIAASGVLVQFAALNGTALYEADREKRKRTGGQGLTGDEIASISFNNLAFLVAVSIGQRIARPFLANLELQGQLQGQLIAARGAGARVESLARQVEATKGTDPAKAHQLNQALADAIAKREAVLARLGEQVQLYEAGQKSALSKAQYERIKAQIAEHAEQKADLERLQILDLLEPAGPNRFEVGGKAAMNRIVDHYGPDAVLVGVDPVTGARTYEIRAKDTSPWRVTERVHAKAHETTRQPESKTEPTTTHERVPVADESHMPPQERTTVRDMKAVDPNIDRDTGAIGVTFQGRGDRIGALAKHVAPESGYFDLVVHGDGRNFAVLHDGQWVKIKPNSVRQYLRAQKGYHGQPIRLLSCEAGADGATTAQAIADGMNVHVKAPTEKIWFSQDKVTGDVELIIGNDPKKPSGGWAEFDPQGANAKTPATPRMPVDETRLAPHERPTDRFPAQPHPDEHAAPDETDGQHPVSLAKPLPEMTPVERAKVEAAVDMQIERIRKERVQGATPASEKAVKDVAYPAAEKTYRERRRDGQPEAGARKAASDSGKLAAEQEWTVQAEKLAIDRANQAIADGTVFDRSAMSAQAKAQLDAYRRGTTKEGAAARKYSTALIGKMTLADMELVLDPEVKASTAARQPEEIKGPPPTSKQTQIAYYFQDGSVIRLKPHGDEFNGWRPSYSVEVKTAGAPPGPSDPSTIAFKVDSLGRAVPKDPDQIANPYIDGKFLAQRSAYDQHVLNSGHRLAK